MKRRAGVALLLCLALHTHADADEVADHLLVKKSQRLMFLMAGDRIVRTYPIALGHQPLGPKRVQGDERTPEGRYAIDGRNPHSHYHLSLHLSYPNARDLRRAAATGADPGGDITIHGLPEDDGGPDPFMFYVDWTDGCIGVGNRAIEELWAIVPDGFPIEIEP